MAQDLSMMRDVLTKRLDRRSLIAATTGGAVALTMANGKLVAAAPGGRTLPVIMAQDGGATITIGTLGEASTINPFVVDESEGQWRCKMIYDELVRPNPATYAAEPGLAASWEINDLEIVFNLQPDAQYSDGTDVVADDVKFFIEGIVNPATASTNQSKFLAIAGADEFAAGSADGISGIEVIDAKTVRITLARPDSAILYSMRYVFLVPSAALQGADLSRASDNEFFQNPIGAGPYVFQSWTVDADFVATANPNFWEGEPQISQFTHRVVPDANALANALQGGDIDGSLYANPTLAEQFEGNDELQILIPPFGSPNGTLFNTRVEPLDRKEVRQAIAMAVNVDAYVQDNLVGLSRPGLGPIAPDSWAHDADLTPIPFDQDAARTMIEEAGIAGTTLTMLCNAGNVLREDWLIRSQADLNEIGLDIQIEFIEWATLVERVTSSRDFEMVGADFSGVTAEPSELFEQYHSTGAQNHTGFTTPELDALLEEAKATIDQEAAIPIYGQIQAILMDEVPFHWAWYRPFFHIVRSDYEGYTGSNLEGGLFRTLPAMTVAQS